MGTSSDDRILFCDLRTLNDASASELFGALDYDIVSGTARPLLPGQILFSLDAKDIDRAMHGLTLVYELVGRVFHPSPIVTVSPILLIGSRYGTWITVDGPSKDIELPRKYDELNAHLNDITEMGQELLAQVNKILKKKLRVISLVDHYADEDSFKAVKGIRNDRDKYTIVTGEHYHYLLKAPAKPQCLYHEWGHSKGAGIETNPGPILVRSVHPRSFFYSSESHHCTDRDVHATRAEPMKPRIREKCGTRSGQENEAFCEIWSFETHLCCRTCAFLNVCSKAEVFHLPCERP